MPDQTLPDQNTDQPTWASRTRVRIGGVTLAVRDLDRVAEYYRGVIGLAPMQQTAQEVVLGAGGAGFLRLVHRPTAAPDVPSTAGLFHTAFLLPARHHLARWLRHASEERQILEGASDHIVSEALYLSDPEGNGIEIYADRPREGWGWTSGHVEMATKRLDLRALLALLDKDHQPWSGAPAGTRVGHVHLRVGDAETAERFYAEAFGLQVTAHYPQAAFMSWDGYHHHLAANAWRSAGAGKRDPHMAGLVSVTFEADDESLASDPVQDPWGTEFRIVSSPTI